MTLPQADSSAMGDLIARFQDLVEVVPALVQPLVVALAGAIPFVEGEVSSVIGVLGGLDPIVAGVAGAIGNILSVLAVVLVTSRVRTAIHANAGGPAGSSDATARPSKGRQRLARFVDRYGVPGASLLGPLALPTQLTAATLVGSGISVRRVLIWQVAAIVLWTTLSTLAATGALALLRG